MNFYTLALINEVFDLRFFSKNKSHQTKIAAHYSLDNNEGKLESNRDNNELKTFSQIQQNKNEYKLS